MKCQNIQEKLGAFLDGELSENDKLEVENHIEECQTCRAEWQTLVRLENIARTSAVKDPGDTYWASLPGRITAQIPGQRSRGRGFSSILGFWPHLKIGYRVVTVAACAAILFVVARNVWTPELAHRAGQPSPAKISDVEVEKMNKGQEAQVEPVAISRDRLKEEKSAVGESAERSAREKERARSTVIGESVPVSMRSETEADAAVSADAIPSMTEGAGKGAALPADRNAELKKTKSDPGDLVESIGLQAGSRRDLDDLENRRGVKQADGTTVIADGRDLPARQNGAISTVTVPAPAGKRLDVATESSPRSRARAKYQNIGLEEEALSKNDEFQYAGLDTLQALQRLVASLESGHPDSVQTLTDFNRILREEQLVRQTPEEMSGFFDKAETGNPVFEQAQLYNQLVNDFGAEDFRSLALRYYRKNAEFLRGNLGDSVFVEQIRLLQE